MIYERYLGTPLTEEEERMVRQIDDGALYYDLKELLHNEQSEADPQFHVVPDYEYRPFGDVKQEFLQIFDYYYGKLNAGDKAGSNGKEKTDLVTRAPERPAPDYELLAAQLKEFALTDPAPMPLLSNASALLKDAMGDVNWAGFYLRREKADGEEPDSLHPHSLGTRRLRNGGQREPHTAGPGRTRFSRPHCMRQRLQR